MTCVTDSAASEKAKEAAKETTTQDLMLTKKEEWLGDVEVTKKPSNKESNNVIWREGNAGLNVLYL